MGNYGSGIKEAILSLLGGSFLIGMSVSSSIVTLPNELGLQTLNTFGLSLLGAFGISYAALKAFPDKNRLGDFNVVPKYMVGAF